eukprot:CAMPEP_0170198728 /NCGR_PEP_ID=MMETSP0040_2-20121228/68946_1 /TAXON_ID=641309 /ORGANISM="Lotharella oceanica, Strain CCMP622" /LENGTH=72 /DNA_ID=CAMNT_0010448771 /DNA_START=24 /DNA_END=242 /DNA_ORIENTATION=-
MAFTIELKEGGKIEFSDVFDGCEGYRIEDGSWKSSESGPVFDVVGGEIALKDGDLIYKSSFFEKALTCKLEK